MLYLIRLPRSAYARKEGARTSVFMGRFAGNRTADAKKDGASDVFAQPTPHPDARLKSRIAVSGGPGVAGYARDGTRPQGRGRSRVSGQLYRPMVVAMIAMGMVQPSIYEVIDMVPMGHGFVPAGRAVLMRADRLPRALHGIGRVDWDGMLINVILVRVMQMAIVKIIDMIIVPDGRVPTVGTMHVAMVDMMLLGAGSHNLFSFLVLGSRETGGFWRSAACSMTPSTTRRT
jgi:hypothetical protein